MNIFFIADVVGDVGRRIMAQELPKIREELAIDFCVANGENIAGGKGITQNLFNKLLRFGVDVVTTGNHIWDNPDILSILGEDVRLLRPLNYPQGNKGIGSTILSLPGGQEVGVLNLQGRVFLPTLDCPFRSGLREVEKMRARTPIILVDLHAEATSEKIAMGWYLDGKVSAVVGTHTHVQSADERVLPKGTGYITDAGMTGSRDSVIGVKKELVIRRLLQQCYVRFEPAAGDPVLNGVLFRVDENTGKAQSVERIFREITL